MLAIEQIFIINVAVFVLHFVFTVVNVAVLGFWHGRRWEQRCDDENRSRDRNI